MRFSTLLKFCCRSVRIVRRPFPCRIACLLVLFGATGLGRASGEEPFDWSAARGLYPGIRHARVELDSPRRMVTNALRIDTRTPGLRFRTTPRRMEWIEGKSETNRQTVRNFIRSSQKADRRIVVAINGDGFSPWPAPFDKEEPTDLAGLAVSDGALVSRTNGSPSFVVRKSGQLEIVVVSPDSDLSDIEMAVSGFGLCLVNGSVPQSGDDLHPRTGLGISTDGKFLLWLTIDGRQPESVGATTHTVGELLRQFGSHTGINMDGGGSTTMAWWDPESPHEDKCKLLNVPVGNGKSYPPAHGATHFEPTERANGNNLGIYFTSH